MPRLVLALLFFVFATFAQAQFTPSGCGYATVVFGNGVNTTKKEAEKKTLPALRDRFKEWLRARPEFGIDSNRIDFSVAYNPTDSVIADLLEVGRQEGLDLVSVWGVILLVQQASAPLATEALRILTDKLATPPEATEQAVADHAATYATFLREGRKVVIVSHSQGNYFANAAVDRLINRPTDYELSGRDQEAIAIVSVASPDSRIARSVVPHLRIGDGLPLGIAEDEVIRGASLKRQLKGLDASLPANTVDPYGNPWLNIYGNVIDDWRHSFLDAYLYPGSQSEQRVFEWIAMTLRATDNPRCAIPANQPPIASFSASVGNANALTVAVGQEILFDPRGSRDQDGQVVGYEWDFGDGSGLSDSTPDLQPHIYTTPGPKTVRLSVTDDRGGTNSTELAIAVTVVQGNRPPIASFTATPAVVKVNGIVRLDASASSDPDGTIAMYAWDFGDGHTSNPSTPTYNTTYAAPGTYTARLTVTDNEGVTSTVTRDIRVTENDPGVILHDNLAFGGGCMQILKEGDRSIIAARLGNGLGGYRTDFGHVLLRVLATGVIDPTFGSGGSVSISNLTPGFEAVDGNSDLCLGAIDSLGRIVLSSSSLRSVGDVNPRAHVVRLTESGALDTSFADQGIFRFDNARFDQLQTMANRITVDTFNRIIVAGQSVRLTCPFSTCSWEGLAFRINADGAVDGSFNGGAGVFTWTDPIVGFQPFIYSYFSGVAVDAMGRILLGGCTSHCANNGGESYAVRLTPSGVLDTSFGDDGNRLLPLYNTSDPANVTSLRGNRFIDHFSFDSENRIIATGSNSYGGAASTIYRLLPDGALDPSFTYGGVLSDFGWVRPFMESAPVGQFQRNGKTTLVGSVSVAYADDYLAVSRLNADGTPDVAFNQADLAYPSTPAQRTWRLIVGNVSCREAPGGAFMQPDGRIVIAGTYSCGYPYTRGGIYLIRINEDGSIDPTFGQ